MFPPIPSWDGLHPLIIHFPIGLLLVAPVFLVLSLLVVKYRRAFALSALVLMALGTVAAFVAVSTGLAAAEIAEKTPEVIPVIENHEEMGETTRNLFTGLTVLYAGLLFGPGVLKKELKPKLALIFHIVFLLFYLACAVVLADTGHLGGRLVHEFGIRALM